jgi:lysophospholipase L1-like esterase
VYFNEGFGINQFNKYRYIGENNPPEKPSQTTRVVLLGDSFVESFQVFDRDFFGNIAENLLSQSSPNYRYELLNFGRSGFDIADMYAYQKIFAEKFDPDYVLYFLSPSDLVPKYADPLRPKTIISNDSLTIDFNFSSSIINKFQKTKKLSQYSVVLNMANNCRKKAKEIPVSSILLGKAYNWFWKQNGKQNILNESGNSPQLHPVTEKIIWDIDPRKVIIVNISSDPLPIHFRQLCEDRELNILDLSTPINKLIERGTDPYEWKVTKKHGHLNKEGHMLVGRELACYLSTILKKDHLLD